MRGISNLARPGSGGRKFSALLAIAMALMSTQCRTAYAGIDNTATATATYGGSTIVSPPSSVSVPVAPANSALSVTKTADATANAVAGQIITYTYTLTNTGNRTLTAIVLSDVHNASGPAPVPGSETLAADAGTSGDSTDAVTNDGIWSVLAPGDTVTFKSTYTVTQSDVDTLQ